MSMYNFHDLKDKIKKYFGFSSKEIQYLIITILGLSIIAGFNDGQKEFVMAHWLFNFFETFLLVTLSVLVFVSVQRIAALQMGHKPTYKTAWIPLLIGIFVSVITKGYVWFILPVGILWVQTMEIHRVGYFRYGLSLYNYGTAAILGPVAAIGLAFLFKIFLLISPNNVLMLRLIHLNIAIAIINALPIPPLAGSKLLFMSRPWYAFAVSGIIGASLFLLFVNNIWLILLGTLTIAIIGTVINYLKFEEL